MDQMVLKVQQWLNFTYGYRKGFNLIEEDGYTGWGTIGALITALQFELGVESPNGVFGPTTTQLYKDKIGSLSTNSIVERTNLNRIVQGALYCKGYDPKEFSDVFSSSTESAIKLLQNDAGLSNCDGSVNVILMKSLLSMDAFKLLNYGDYKGTEIIRTIQQYLNRKYISNQYFSSDLGLVPCNGIYDRITNKALVYALQIEEGVLIPNGVFGPETQSKFKAIPGQTTESRFVYLLQAALYCNGENPNGFDGSFGNGCRNAVINFQKFCQLSPDGSAGLQTFKSLLLSTGDPLRKGTACDLSEPITDSIATFLKNDGRLYVGRYLTGRYRIKPDELDIISKNNLKLIPLMQVIGEHNYSFDYSSGIRDALDALTVCRFYKFSPNTVIYFAVDYDALISDIEPYLEPYFSAVNKVFSNKTANPDGHRIGVYAPRAICKSLAKKGLTCSSYVSDMSTLFSSNLGERLPDDWAFDQIHEYSIDNTFGKFKYDNVLAREGHIEYCSNFSTTYSFSNLMKKINSNPLLKSIGLELSGLGTIVFVDNPDLEISVSASHKLNIGDESYSLIQMENGQFSGSEFRSDLTEIKASLTTDGEAALSKSIEFCEGVNATIKVYSHPKSLKIEIESDDIDVKDIWPLPITITLCIKIKRNDNLSISQQVDNVLDYLKSLAYNFAGASIKIGEKVITFLGYVLLGVISVLGIVGILIAIITAPLTAASAIFLIISGLSLELLNEKPYL